MTTFVKDSHEQPLPRCPTLSRWTRYLSHIESSKVNRMSHRYALAGHGGNPFIVAQTLVPTAKWSSLLFWEMDLTAQHVVTSQQ